ncbi:MAG: hypothetical protein JWM89_1297 [Acidimicrobiales bacterium]|nr:hypothetical protein [Acidimicrobiales bacterium]
MRVGITDRVATGRVTSEHVLDDVPETLSLRDLIRLRVREEVARHNANPSDVFDGLVCPEDGEAGPSGYRLPSSRRIDWEQQADAAIRAFEHNGFFVLVGNAQVTDLDAQVDLSEATEVAFVRLVPLVGG